MVIGNGPAAVHLPACEYEALVLDWDVLLEGQLALHVVNGVQAVHPERCALAVLPFHKDLEVQRLGGTQIRKYNMAGTLSAAQHITTNTNQQLKQSKAQDARLPRWQQQ